MQPAKSYTELTAFIATVTASIFLPRMNGQHFASLCDKVQG